VGVASLHGGIAPRELEEERWEKISIKIRSGELEFCGLTYNGKAKGWVGTATEQLCSMG